MSRRGQDVLPVLVVLALSLSVYQPAVAQWLSCKSPENVQIKFPRLLEELQHWTQNEKYAIDGDVEAVDATSNLFSIRVRFRTV